MTQHFVIHAIDHPDALPTRQEHYADHRAYLAGPLPVRILVSGPLMSGDGEHMIGSLFLLEAPDRDAVQLFHDQDPFKAAGIWQTVSINPFLKRQDNR